MRTSSIKIPLRLGLIGLAGYGGTYFKTLAGREDVVIAAICDATISNRIAGGEVDDFATATLKLEGCASISIETTYLSHLPDALAYLRRTWWCRIFARERLARESESWLVRFSNYRLDRFGTPN